MPADGSTNVPRPPAPIPNARPHASAVTGAIRQAAKSTGASFDYLLATAKVESDLDPNLSMSTSTATGLFQFLDQTWLGVMKTAGRAFGFPQYADAITQTSSGRYVVEDPVMREEMMKLRKDPAANAVMGGVITQQNTAVLAARLGRQPTEGELYVAHFFGPYAAANVIQLAASNPNANAAAMFPAAARANQPIFYDRQGNARTIAGVYNELVRRYQAAKASPTRGLTPDVVAAAANARKGATVRVPPVSASARMQVANAQVPDTAAITSAYAEAQSATPQAPIQSSQSSPQSVFHSLFETDARQGAVSPVVADLWTTPLDQDKSSAGDTTALRPPGLPLDLFQALTPAPRSLSKGG